MTLRMWSKSYQINESELTEYHKGVLKRGSNVYMIYNNYWVDIEEEWDDVFREYTIQYILNPSLDKLEDDDINLLNDLSELMTRHQVHYIDDISTVDTGDRIDVSVDISIVGAKNVIKPPEFISEYYGTLIVNREALCNSILYLREYYN